MEQLRPETCRAARAMLKIKLRELAMQTGVHYTAIGLFERTGLLSDKNKSKIQAFFIKNKIEFTNGKGVGVRLKFD